MVSASILLGVIVTLSPDRRRTAKLMFFIVGGVNDGAKMAASRVSSARRLCHRYKYFFYIAIFLVLTQLYLAYNFYYINQEELTKLNDWKKRVERLEKVHETLGDKHKLPVSIHSMCILCRQCKQHCGRRLSLSVMLHMVTNAGISAGTLAFTITRCVWLLFLCTHPWLCSEQAILGWSWTLH